MMQYRSRRGNQVTVGRDWTMQEVNHVKSMAGKVKSRALAWSINRSYESLRQMAKREGISLRRRKELHETHNA